MSGDCNGSYDMFLTDFWKKWRIHLTSLGIFTFPWLLVPFWQYLGCRFLCQSSVVKVYYQLIDLNGPGFESHIGGKIKTLKSNGDLSIFC